MIRQPTSVVTGLLPLLSAELVKANAVRNKCAIEIVDDQAHLTTIDSEGILANSKKTEHGEFCHPASNMLGSFLKFVRIDTVTAACGDSGAKCAVVAVPRYMSSSLETIKQCLRDADIGEDVRVIFDDVAVLSAYGLNTSQETKDTLVFDWGANSFSASILRVTGGNTTLLGFKNEFGTGGHKLDTHLAAILCKNFEKKTKLEASTNARAMRKLCAAMDDMRKTLSVAQLCPVDVEAFCEGVDLKDKATRAMLEGAMRESGWLKTPASVLEALLAEVSDANITDCVFVGGMCRIPSVKSFLTSLVENAFSEDVIIHDSIPCDEVCALGASTEAFNSSLDIVGLRSLRNGEKPNAELPLITSRIPTSTELVTVETLASDIGLVLCAKSSLKAAGKNFVCPAASFSTLFATGSVVPMETPAFHVAKDSAIVVAAKVGAEGDDHKIAMLSAKPIQIAETGRAKLLIEVANKAVKITVFWQEVAQSVWTPIGTINV
eukprot:TRINITY_DN4494_c0_g1_i5.p1 TRINITY_DN4494_c0_g1~~TRINITY_DN4494_c0_g1_i5.p1  ORF type:complete len:492 (+),score=187.49 TRINITY_DN4494_c0_g1_i5:324-1799(+)